MKKLLVICLLLASGALHGQEVIPYYKTAKEIADWQEHERLDKELWNESEEQRAGRTGSYLVVDTPKRIELKKKMEAVAKAKPSGDECRPDLPAEDLARLNKGPDEIDKSVFIWFRVGKVIDESTVLVTWGDVTILHEEESSCLTFQKKNQNTKIAAILKLPAGLKPGDTFVRQVWVKFPKYIWNKDPLQTFTTENDTPLYTDPFAKKK